MTLIGILLDVFEISGRGCVVLVDVKSGDCRAGDSFSIQDRDWMIAGIDIQRYSPDRIERMKQGWKPPLALLLRDAKKSELLELVGCECTAVGSPGAEQ